MTFAATAAVVLVASPGDTAEERAAIQLELGRWNVSRGRSERLVVIPWLYEQHSVPMLGGSAQSVINSQALDLADVVVAFFDSRLGTATDEAVSGTAEEIEKAHAAGKPVHVYFSAEPVNRDQLNLRQLGKLQKFRDQLRGQGLLGDYSSPDNLAAQVREAIDYDVQSGSLVGAPAPAVTTGARFTCRHDYQREQNGFDNKGRLKYRTRVNDLVVKNEGDATAEDVSVEVTTDEGTDIHFEGFGQLFDLPRGAAVGATLIPLRGRNVIVTLSWKEVGIERTAKVPVRLQA